MIQPFDNGKFDKRFDDVFVPAITQADLEPYRVDRDPSVNDLLEGIKSGIAESTAFLADITTDNPNVWYELGFAMSLDRPYCICCSEERTTEFPFDVNHLNIIAYKVGSSSDFKELETKITKRLKAVVVQATNIREIASSVSSLTETEGLAPQEMVALTILFEYQFDEEPGLSASGIHNSMQRAGFTKVAANLAILELTEKGYIDAYSAPNYQGDPYTMYKVNNRGLRWLRENRDKLVMRAGERRTSGVTDEEIPF
ncbi:MAG: hypothetical protein ACHP7P_12665 [Terriglobales bacterium]